MFMRISSEAFSHNGLIPIRHTCDGSNLSPPLAWAGVPVNTRSLALIVEDPDAPDPDAPTTTWVHWILYNIPPQNRGLPAGVALAGLPVGTLQGTNDWHRTGYGGPCPPIGLHRYVHKLFALDCTLPDLANPDRAALEDAMRGHILVQAELIGLYQRRGRNGSLAAP